MRRRGLVLSAGVLVAAVLALAGLRTGAAGQQEQTFPHERHQGLFPLCTGCHAGIPLGDRADYYPNPAVCRGCHDGVREVRISWQGPAERVTNLKFEHQQHDQGLVSAGDPPQECASCHIPEGAGRMAVSDSIQLGTCWGCHAHTASEHQVDAQCSTCHVPLFETHFDRARIQSLPEPSDHRAASFLDSDHGRLVQQDASRCATCHTQQRCVACHVDTERLAIASFPAAPESMELPVTTARYVAPASHAESGWLGAHGAEASRSACATCHTRESCTSCHVEPVPDVLGELPAKADVRAPGVQVVARAPESHGSLFFMEAHPTLAASGDASCATCHEESFCVSCHDGPVKGGYHPPEFLSRHTAEAFGRDAECSNCHNTEVFCRECHVQMGLVGNGRLGPGYHDASPVWLIRHGQAARQNLESCASCHRQIDCTQCHGLLGAFKVSPHSASFDAARAWARSPRTCFACHIGNPLDGN
jgi:hypothetical protein